MTVDKLLTMLNRIETFQETGYYSGYPTHGLTPDLQYILVNLDDVDDKRSYIMNYIKLALFQNYRKSKIESKVGKPDYIFFTDTKLATLLQQEELIMGSYFNYSIVSRDEPYFANTIVVVPVIPGKPEIEIPNVLEFGIKH